MGFIFQFHHLLPEFTAVENIAMPLIISGMPEADATDSALSALDRVGLKQRSDHRPGQLSGGEQQRVAIARAIVSKPSLILADEPTGNSDFNTAKGVTDLLLEVQRDLHSLLLIVTHSIDLAEAMQQRLEMQPGGSLRVL